MANINDLRKMCREHQHCTGCPLYHLDNCMIYRLPDNIDDIVNKWLAERPIKTYAMDFFEKFPDAQRRTTGIPIPCIRAIYSKFHDVKCSAKCPECWNREIKNN